VPDEDEWAASCSDCFTPGERALLYPFHMRLGGPLSQSGHGGEEEKSLPLLGTEPQSTSQPAHSSVTILTHKY